VLKNGDQEKSPNVRSVGRVAPLRGQVASRRTVLRALIGTSISLAARVATAAEDTSIPSFESGRYQFAILRPQIELPPIRLFGLDGRTIDLSSLRGKPILLNFWATWCAACRTELPILDRLFEQNRRSGLQVIAVSEDRSDRETVTRFLRINKIEALPVYRDPNGYVAFSDRDNEKKAPFALYGMPITYLITASGRVVGYMPGAADWMSQSASELIEYLHRS
jgi:thiol-disulfide isomerase/thioredoxin